MASYKNSVFTYLKVDHDLFLQTTRDKALKLLNENHKIDSDGCWIWTGEVNYVGTGVVGVNSKRFGVKKIAYLVYIGNVPQDKAVYNTCQKKLCFRPDHLYLEYAGFSYLRIKNKNQKFIANVCRDYEAGISITKIRKYYLRDFYTIRKIVMSYKDKLRDPRWQKKRLEIFQRDNWTCQFPGCGDTKTELHVHHTKYIYGANPWDVPDKFLKTVCSKHHKLLHLKRRRKKGFK